MRVRPAAINCKVGLQTVMEHHYRSSSGGDTPDTDSQGRQAFLVIGDSIAAGLTGHTASTLPSAGTAYEFDRNTDTIIDYGSGAGITGFSFNSKSPWAKFCIDYNVNTGNKPVIINRAASASTISPALSGLIDNDWQTSGSNYNDAVTAANTCLSQMGATKLKGILVSLGINDMQGQSGTGSFSVAQVSAYLSTLIDNLRTEFGTDVPILFLQIGRTSSVTVSTRLSGIRNAIRSKCSTYDNVHFGGSLGAFQIAGYYADSIHPNQSGNDASGAMFARWYNNSSVTNKWARSIVACHFDEISSAYKTKINDFLTTWETQYLGFDAMYVTKASLKNNTAFDWAFLNGPESDGSFTFSANSHVSTNGTSSLFRLGNSNLNSISNTSQNDYGYEVKIKTVSTSAGVTAFAFGVVATAPTRATFIGQLNTGGVNWACTSGTSFTDAGETALTAASWMVVRTSSTSASLYKDGVLVDGPVTDTSTTVDLNYYLGARNLNGTAGSFYAGEFERVLIFKQSLITDKAAFITALNTLQS